MAVSSLVLQLENCLKIQGDHRFYQVHVALNSILDKDIFCNCEQHHMAFNY